MTKGKLRRLMELAGLGHPDFPAQEFASEEEREERRCLLAEFEAWEPEVCGFDARHWMNLAQQYAEECITLRHRGGD